MSLETLRAELIRYLQEWDVPARAGWPGKGMGERQEPVVAVTLKRGKLGPAGFQNYLGEEWDPEKGQWTERYGRKAELVFGLDIYGGGRTGEADLQAAFDRMARALMDRGPEGLLVQEFSCGETEYDSRCGRMKKPAQAVCAAYVWNEEERETFREIEVRGGMRQ